MKNFIFIDVDTDREKPIVFGKPPDITPPETTEEAKAMILNDIACLAEAISTLILMADQNDYGKKDELAIATVSTIYELLQNPKNLEDEPKTEN
jgi:hypothetical protein